MDLDSRLAAQLRTRVAVLTVVAWVAISLRRQAGSARLVRALLPPAAWAVFTLVRGELIDFYPYPFVDDQEYGLERGLNIAVSWRCSTRSRGPWRSTGASARVSTPGVN